MSINYAQLTEDINKAKLVAQKAAEAHDQECDAQGVMRDGGTCNLDSMYLMVGRDSSISRNTKKLREALAAANRGHEPSFNTYSWQKGFWLGGRWGQGRRNEVAVKAGVEYLKAKGWPVRYWAQMD